MHRPELRRCDTKILIEDCRGTKRLWLGTQRGEPLCFTRSTGLKLRMLPQLHGSSSSQRNQPAFPAIYRLKSWPYVTRNDLTPSHGAKEVAPLTSECFDAKKQILPPQSC